MDCPCCGAPMEMGAVSVKVEFRLRDASDAFEVLWNPVDTSGKQSKDWKRERMIRPEESYVKGFAALSPRRRLGEGWYCAQCGKVLCLLDTADGPENIGEKESGGEH